MALKYVKRGASNKNDRIMCNINGPYGSSELFLFCCRLSPVDKPCYSPDPVSLCGDGLGALRNKL